VNIALHKRSAANSATICGVNFSAMAEVLYDWLSSVLEFPTALLRPQAFPIVFRAKVISKCHTSIRWLIYVAIEYSTNENFVMSKMNFWKG